MELKKILENARFVRETVGELPVGNFSPEEVGELAYRRYWEYNCEYGVITAFNEAAGFPLTYEEIKALSRKLPHRWNAVCGALTGAFYLLATTLPEEKVELGIEELIKFHNETPLPSFKGERVPDLPKAAVGSILCRDSIVNWCKATGIPPRSLERAERCAAITADVAIKCGQLVLEHLPEAVKE